MRVILKTSKPTRLIRSLMGLLVLLYLAGSLQLDSLHRLFHQHDQSYAHTEELEQNACHRTVFHQATENTCDHPTHISEDKNCPWCNGSIHYETILSESQPHTDLIFAEIALSYTQPKPILPNLLTLSSRGPPDQQI